MILIQISKQSKSFQEEDRVDHPLGDEYGFLNKFHVKGPSCSYAGKRMSMTLIQAQAKACKKKIGLIVFLSICQGVEGQSTSGGC